MHRLDAAVLFRLALEGVPAGTRLHAVDDEAVPFKDIAEVIARHLDVPVRSVPAEQATEHFGFLGLFAGADIPASQRDHPRLDRLGADPGRVARRPGRRALLPVRGAPAACECRWRCRCGHLSPTSDIRMPQASPTAA